MAGSWRAGIRNATGPWWTFRFRKCKCTYDRTDEWMSLFPRMHPYRAMKVRMCYGDGVNYITCKEKTQGRIIVSKVRPYSLLGKNVQEYVK